MSKRTPIKGWLEPKPATKLPDKPIAYVAANQCSSGLKHGKSQQRNYCKPVSEQLKHTTPTHLPQTHKMPHIRPQQYNQSYVNKVQAPKPITQNKVVRNKTRNIVHLEVNNTIVQNISQLNLNGPKPVNTNKKPVTCQTTLGPKPWRPKPANQNYTRRRPINNNGCVINVTNNYINHG